MAQQLNGSQVKDGSINFIDIQTIPTATLLGRATIGTGLIEQITLGSNLSFSGTALNSTVGGITSFVGTTNRIDVSGSPTAAINISPNYIGQSTITTLGLVTTGTWQGNTINYAYLGTGGGGVTKFLREDNTWQIVATSSGTPIQYAETPSGLVNGTNAVFTLTAAPASQAGLIIVIDGSTQYAGSDYSLSGSTVTFTFAPASTSTIFSYYNTLVCGAVTDLSNYVDKTSSQTIGGLKTFSNNVNIVTLGTLLTAPVTTGTTKMVVTDQNGGLSFTNIPSSGIATETDPVVAAINGIVKSNGVTISAAVSGTDYSLPNATNTNYVNDYRLANFVAGTNYALPNATNTNYVNDYRLANFVAGTNYLAINGSAAALTSFPIFNQNTTGNASTATNLTGLTTTVTTLNNQSGTNTGDNSSNTLYAGNTGDNATNTQYSNDYRLANFVAGTNYLTPSGSAAALINFPTFNQNTTGTASGSYIGTQTLTAGVTYTSSVGTTNIKIRMVGGGGGGGGVTGVASQAAAAGGGGGGSYLEKVIAVTSNTGYTISIGVGGTAGASTGTTGGNGGNTTIIIGATTYTTTGGVGGAPMLSGVTLITSSGGLSGTISTNGDLNTGGSPGFGGIRLSASACLSGNGASSQFGAGGLGTSSANSSGGVGRGFGAGGGGAANIGNSNQPGGVGAPGIIVIEEYR